MDEAAAGPCTRLVVDVLLLDVLLQEVLVLLLHPDHLLRQGTL